MLGHARGTGRFTATHDLGSKILGLELASLWVPGRRGGAHPFGKRDAIPRTLPNIELETQHRQGGYMDHVATFARGALQVENMMRLGTTETRM